MGEYSKTAVAFGDLKNSSLHFEHVIPACLAAELVTGGNWQVALPTEITDLLPPDLLRLPRFREDLGQVNHLMHGTLCKHAIHRFDMKPNLPGFSEEEYATIETAAASAYFQFLEDYSLTKLPLVTLDGKTSNAGMLDEPDSPTSPVVTLANIRVVDASRASWAQIFAFRRDAEARAKLRRLRLFAHATYEGQSRAYVEDDLLTRIEDYEEAARQLGLETVQGALSVVLNSKLTAGVLAGSILSTLFASPPAALATAALGAVVEVGHVAVQLSQRRFALRKFVRDNPVSFVSYARKAFAAR